MDTTTVSLTILLVAVGVAIIAYPLIHYLRVGWEAKRCDIMDGLDAEARLAYFRMFNQGKLPQRDASTAFQDFEDLYTKWYGRKSFVVPSILLLVVAGISIVAIVTAGLRTLHYIPDTAVLNFPKTGLAAIAGAYLWVVDDFISRARRLDFAPSDVMWGVLRLAIAIPMGYAFSALAPTLGPFVAFALGAFPLTTLNAMLRRLANKKLGIDDTVTEASDDIIKLQGINRAIAERLSNEDVTTVTQIAYCDPVHIVMRSNLTFNFVTDCMNQALAWMYLNSDLDKIRPLGLRGAVEIRGLLQDLDRGGSLTPAEQVAKNTAEAAFPKISSAIGQDPATLRIVFAQISGDPYTDFLCRVWPATSAIGESDGTT